MHIIAIDAYNESGLMNYEIYGIQGKTMTVNEMSKKIVRICAQTHPSVVNNRLVTK